MRGVEAVFGYTPHTFGEKSASKRWNVRLEDNLLRYRDTTAIRRRYVMIRVAVHSILSSSGIMFVVVIVMLNDVDVLFANPNLQELLFRHSILANL